MLPNRKSFLAICAIGGLSLAAFAWATHADEKERKIAEKDVPPAALAALNKLANGAPLTEFSEEIEHGKTCYEGSWKGPHGNVDALVTPAGDLVELEEHIPADAVPKAVMNAAKTAAGPEVQLYFERKTLTLYEVKYKKGDRTHELMLGPDGRQRGHEESSDDAD